MRRLVTALALAVCLFGCGSAGEPVELLTDVTAGPGGCWLNAYQSNEELVAHPEYGTAIKYGSGAIEAAVWPRGFTARRNGSEVEVLDASGAVVATTGRRYAFYWLGSRPHGEVLCGDVDLIEEP